MAARKANPRPLWKGAMRSISVTTTMNKIWP